MNEAQLNVECWRNRGIMPETSALITAIIIIMSAEYIERKQIKSIDNRRTYTRSCSLNLSKKLIKGN